MLYYKPIDEVSPSGGHISAGVSAKVVEIYG